MASLKIEVSKTAVNRKGTCEVGIRLYHHHEKRLIETGIYVSKTEMTKKWTIRNELVKRKVKALLKDYNAKLKQLELDQYDMNIDAVVNYIVGVGEVSVDIIQYGREWIKEHEDQKCSRNHLVALNAFIKFVGRESYMCNDITKVFMKSFEKWLGDKKTARSVYPQLIKRIFNSAKQRYNEGREDNKVIKRTLEFYRPPHVEVQTEKRALPVDIIRAIANLPDDPEGRTIADLARDVFTISFMLMGTNTIDLLECKWDGRGNITYDRAKTKDRRPDHARIVIKPHPLLMPLIKKYACVLDKKERYVFRFNRMYRNPSDFSYNLNRGLKEVGNMIDEEGLTFYAARHTMATIAFNETDIDKMTIHDMLNHQLPVYKITDIYIKKDFRKINEANFKLIDFVFNDMEKEKAGTHQDKHQGGALLTGDFLTNVVDTVVDISWQLTPQDINTRKSWNVEIKVSYKGQSKLIGTSIFVSENDVSEDGQLTNEYLIKRCEALVNSCKERISRLDLKAAQYDINDLVNKLLS